MEIIKINTVFHQRIISYYDPYTVTHAATIRPKKNFSALKSKTCFQANNEKKKEKMHSTSDLAGQTV
jgi:hypothetical protein